MASTHRLREDASPTLSPALSRPTAQHEEAGMIRLAAFACGVVVGAAAAVLLAPAAGRDTRARIGRQATSAAGHARRAVRERRDQLHAFIKRYGVIGLAKTVND